MRLEEPMQFKYDRIKNLKIVPIIFLFFFKNYELFSQQNSDTNMMKTLHDKVICMDYRKANSPLEYIGSAFITKKDNNYFIVTAFHNLQDILPESLFLYFEDDGIFKIIPLLRIITDFDSALKHSLFYDLAVIQVDPQIDPINKLLNQYCISFSSIVLDESLIKKGSDIIGVGFDDMTGSFPNKKPQKKIVISKIENEIIEFPRADNHEKSRLFFLKDNDKVGMSGGPVYVELKKEDGSEYYLTGIFHGSVVDSTDLSHHASITPLTELEKLLQ